MDPWGWAAFCQLAQRGLWSSEEGQWKHKLGKYPMLTSHSCPHGRGLLLWHQLLGPGGISCSGEGGTDALGRLQSVTLHPQQGSEWVSPLRRAEALSLLEPLDFLEYFILNG